MATNPSAQFWIRTDGNDSQHGGGYDSGISGAGTNYCDQASAQASWTNLLLSSGVLTDSSATGMFSNLMVGSLINVTSQGFYWITGYTNSNVVSVTNATGTSPISFTGATGYLGGAFRNLYSFSIGGSDGSITGANSSLLIPGNQVNLRAGGSGSVISPDYAQTGYSQFTSGDNVNGFISFVAYNGTPYVVGDGLLFLFCTLHRFVNIYFSASSTSNIVDGIFDAPNQCSFIGGVIDGNNQTGAIAMASSSGDAILNSFVGVEIKGGNATGDGISLAVSNNGQGNYFKNCSIHDWGGCGIKEFSGNTGTQIFSCAIYTNVSHGVFLSTSRTGPSVGGTISFISNCTIDNNGGDGIHISSTATANNSIIIDNNITNNVAYGINVAAGTVSTNAASIVYEDYNNVYNNGTANYNGINGGTNNISVNPNYAGGGNYTPSNTALIAAAPVSFA